jgi:hypothetical protein
VSHDVRHDLWVAIVGGLFATLGWTFAIVGLHRLRMWIAFHHLSGKYKERRKYAEEDTGNELRIDVKGSRLLVTFTKLDRPGSVTGQIAMDERTRNSGRGQYEDITPRPEADPEQAWGFWDVQFKATDANSDSPPKILVHTTYANKEQIPTFQGYEWRKVS